MTAYSSVLRTSSAGVDDSPRCPVDGVGSTGRVACDAVLPPALLALCAIARFHQVAADPATLAHQLGLSPADPFAINDLLRAAKHLGLQAKRSRTTVERLGLTALPALAVMRNDDDGLHVVLLAQSDGKRVLFQDVLGTPAGENSRPKIESVEVFAARWTGELILISSRAAMAGALARFDFSWFIPALVKYRRLLGEVLLISFMLQIFGLVSPLFFQVDRSAP